MRATRTRRAKRSEPAPTGAPRATPGGERDAFAGNRAALDRAIDALFASLEARLASQEESGARRAPPVPPVPAVERLGRLFDLSEFERGVVLLCAAHALDGRFGPLFAAAQGDRTRTFPTFALALAFLPAAHWDALTPVGRLRRWRLVETSCDGDPIASRIALDERVLHWVAGASYLDDRISGLVRPVSVSDEGSAAPGDAVARVVAAWQGAPSALGCPVVEVSAADAGAARSVVAGACGALGLALHAVRAEDLPRGVAEREPLQRLWAREALLAHSALFVDAGGVDAAEAAGGLSPFLEGLPGLVVVGTRAPLVRLSRACERIEIARPAAAERLGAWRRALGPLAAGLNGELDALAGQFRLAPDEIALAGVRAAERARSAGGPAFAASLWSSCREQARGGLDALADRVEGRADWGALVLPQPQLDALRLIELHVRHRSLVYERWGFGRRGKRGLGIGALFCGPSGTGKTLAAEILANTLALDLYRIDLAALVSKYVGETEKNLRRVFDAADASGAILLFDEADALFGKRSEVRDSHDRYANIEVSYLLQRIELYRGLAILTTNLEEAIDPAFLRRIRFLVHFPFPDARLRQEIWHRVFPEGLPREELDLERLARLNLSGGSIQNVALNAAFLAAEAGEPVRMRHLRRAAEAEYAKLGKPLLDAELGEGA